jgi:hypothetical protein
MPQLPALYELPAERPADLSERFSKLSPAQQHEILLSLGWLAGTIIGERIGYLLTAPFRKRSERWPQ